MDSARHVITHIFNPHSLSKMVSYDVASAIHQSLLDGLSKLLAERAIAMSNHAAELDALREIVKVGEADADEASREANHAVGRGLHSSTSQLNLSRL